jgi:glycosyltransferase involved in cell wall biosynthesis
MRIAVVTSSPPLSEGGHMVIARSLVQALREAGHAADIVVTPQNRFGRQSAAYVATWLTDLGTSDGEPIDQVISLRFPSYAVRHPRHVCWLNHTMREYYDQWDRFSASLSPQGRLKERIRRAWIHRADRYLLTRNVRSLFVQSQTILSRLSMWPEVRARVLYPPPPQRPYRCDAYGDYVFMVSRLTPLKRAELVIDALATRECTGVRAVIGGEGELAERLRTKISDLGLADRVSLAGRLTEAELLGHLARCRAVCFPPVEEDYGFVTVEAFASAKPVITCHDSGGPAELVRDGVTGLVSAPTAAGIAAAIRRLMDDPAGAERMGMAAREFVAKLNWPETVRQLTDVQL